MKIFTSVLALLLVMMASASVVGCKTKETTTEKMSTQVNPVTGTETVHKETTTQTKK